MVQLLLPRDMSKRHFSPFALVNYLIIPRIRIAIGPMTVVLLTSFKPIKRSDGGSQPDPFN